MRHVIRLFNYYKSYQTFFKENNIQIDANEIQKYRDEFCTSKYLREYSIESEKFFDYLVNRFHMIGTFDMFDYTIPLEYKGYKAVYDYEEKLDIYVGHVENEFDSSISGKTLSELDEDFRNTVDFVILNR